MQSAKLMSALIGAVVIAAPVFGQDDNSDQNDFTLEVFGGLTYSDNVAVPQLDASSGVGDFAATLDASVGFKTDIFANTKLDIGYDFGQIRYLDETAFNQQQHSFTAGLAYELADGIDLGLDGGYYLTMLGGDKFLTQTRFSPSIARMFGDATYVRASWAYTDIDFEDIDSRDGDNHTVGIDSYVFLTDEGYVNFGVFYEKESTEIVDFSYDGYVLSAGAQVPFLDTTFNASLDYNKRDYDGLEDRDDDRVTFKAGIETDLFAVLTLKPEYTYRDVSSSVDQFSYQEHVVSVKLGYVF